MTGVLLVALGAGLGAPTRYLVDRAVQARHETVMPWGTLTVNLAGALLLGFLTGLDAPREAVLAVGVGFCGALTTFSTFAFETLRLWQTGARRAAALNVALALVLGLGAAVVGHLVGAAL